MEEYLSDKLLTKMACLQSQMTLLGFKASTAAVPLKGCKASVARRDRPSSTATPPRKKNQRPATLPPITDIR